MSSQVTIKVLYDYSKKKMVTHLQTFNIMAHKEIKTSIDINATPEKVWSILTNFQDYPNWNPFITSVEGNFAVGEKVKIHAGGMKFSPTVLAYKPNKELRWLGSLLFKGLFDGEHSFEIINKNDGTVTFNHAENFNGILVGLFAKKLDLETKQRFNLMNEKLKELAES